MPPASDSMCGGRLFVASVSCWPNGKPRGRNEPSARPTRPSTAAARDMIGLGEMVSFPGMTPMPPVCSRPPLPPLHGSIPRKKGQGTLARWDLAFPCI